MTSTVDRADREVKAKHRALWASGDYTAVAAKLIPALGPELVRACGVRAYGPTIAVYRIAALDRDFLSLLTTWNSGGAYIAEYLLVTPRKAAT